ncbi:methyltransferase domain-containing protein [Leptospira sp. 2 VSF19]|uniref:Methyltransferase domain-containing protein n=1 Tax=Leptospira soteropolitanensis TaxID=2950025 RepID=A0AAW5VCV1_9LEPT|nr:class I SAM-dependent methyltransferase [Leptospira soteropolitanensis]MCW7491388.1 methyltransferase domain-containing protein [Leptospira soteropolitanensis]MCW7498973.1 methyltransferase domain-containing protein [Leptospira soteropolitanensis]MCW7521435.1 methyltransferase domain-containing protein [Leptospira soteropolitanensis]MCW7525076.1 methyltransferase domain-containing protein [Leptospira soteropolitanensis]MCW7528944.1 methyltransferase domain-containing protein [Leptospira sot
MKRSVNFSFHHMVRIPEPELMEDPIQVESYAQADFEMAHSFLIRKFQDRLPLKFTPESILDLGCGPGDMSSRLFSQFPDSNFTFVDGSEFMLDLCKKRMGTLTSKKRNQKMEFKKELVQDFVPESPFDLVFSNSLLHHLHDPFEFWGAVQRSIHTDSFIFISDLMRPDSLNMADHLLERYANNEPDVLKKDFYNSLLAAYRIEEVKEMLEIVRLNTKLNLEPITDRHWICYSKPRH